MSQLLITRQGQTIVSASHQETEGITQFHVVPSEEIRSGEADGDFRIGDIYLGLVQNIVPRIGAAFVQIAPGQNGYLPLNENRHFCFANPKNTEKLCIGDKLLVQIDKEPVKTKPVSLTTEFTLSGKYAVLLPYQPEVRVSTKIREKAERERLWNIGDSCLAEYGYGCIFRTNAAGHEDGELHAALRRLAEQFQSIRDKGIHALRHAKLYSGIPAYLADLRDAGEEELTKIQTDDPELYREMAEFLTENQPEDLPKLSLYRDEQISLSALYSIQTRLEKALAPKVWMKSGAYLVIEHTEALTVIDVNSGKARRVKGLRRKAPVSSIWRRRRRSHRN